MRLNINNFFEELTGKLGLSGAAIVGKDKLDVCPKDVSSLEVRLRAFINDCSYGCNEWILARMTHAEPQIQMARLSGALQQPGRIVVEESCCGIGFTSATIALLREPTFGTITLKSQP